MSPNTPRTIDANTHAGRQRNPSWNTKPDCRQALRWQSPSHGEEHIRHVIRLTDDSKPAVNHNLVAGISLDELGVLDCLPRDLGEGVALDDLVLFAETDGVLLALGAVPHPVEEEIYDCECCEGIAVPVILGWVVVGQVECAVAVCEGHSREVPESEEEAQLFEVHVPETLLVDNSREGDKDI